MESGINLRNRLTSRFAELEVYVKKLGVLRAIIILALLVLAASLGAIPSKNLLYLFATVGASAGLVGTIVLYRLGRFEYAVLLLIPVGGLMNFVWLPTGYQSRIPMSMVLAMGLFVLWILELILKRDKEKFKPSPANTALLSFVAVSIIAYAWSNFFRDPLVQTWESWPFVQLAALLVNILLPLLVLMIANKIREVKWMKYIAWALLGVGAFVILALLANIHALDALYTNGQRGMFATVVASTAYGLALYDKKLPTWVRGALILLVLGWVFYLFILFTSWLSGWVPMFTALAMITIARSKKLTLVILIVAALFVALRFNWLYDRVVTYKVAQGDTNRPILWSMNVNLVMDHPLFGVGPAGYAVYYMTYNPDFALSTHNNYFDVLSQTGVIGFVIFVWMMITLLVMGIRLRRHLEGRRNFEEAIANIALAALVGALVSMMLGDWVLPFAYNQTIRGFDNAMLLWIWLGMMVGLYRMTGVDKQVISNQ